MSLGKGLESLIPQKSNQQNVQQSNQQVSQQNPQSDNTDAPVLLPLTDTEQYHQLAPEIIENKNIEIKVDENLEKFQPAQKHKESIFHIEVDKIKPNPYQPRKIFDEESLKELAASIREFGVIQPIVVTKIETETENGTQVEYQLIAGERRLKASKMIGLERIPAIIKRLVHKSHHMELAIVENLQRQNLDPVETARAYARLSDEFGHTQREIAAKLGKSRETIANALRLLNLPTEIQDALAKGQINESQARILLSIDDLAKQMAVFKDLLTNNLSVRELKNRIRTGSQNQGATFGQEQSISGINVDPEIHHMQEQLTELLGAPVKIEQSGDKGKIVISFYSPEEIKGIIDKIQK